MRGFMERQAAKDSAFMVSKARRQPYLAFIYRERLDDGLIALRLKTLRSSINRSLERLARSQKWVSAQADANPEQFDTQHEIFVRRIRPFEKVFSEIRENVLELALSFEGGRQRLR